MDFCAQSVYTGTVLEKNTPVSCRPDSVSSCELAQPAWQHTPTCTWLQAAPSGHHNTLYMQPAKTGCTAPCWAAQ